MTAVSDALAALFGDPNHALDAVYRDPSGATTTLAVSAGQGVLVRRPDAVAEGFGGTQLQQDSILLEALASVLAAPRKGGRIEIDAGSGGGAHAGAVFEIQRTPLRRDPDRLIWTLDCADGGA